jgi:hypothetical protein
MQKHGNAGGNLPVVGHLRADLAINGRLSTCKGWGSDRAIICASTSGFAGLRR